MASGPQNPAYLMRDGGGPASVTGLRGGFALQASGRGRARLMRGCHVPGSWRLPLGASCLLHLGLAWAVAFGSHWAPVPPGSLRVRLLAPDAITAPEAMPPAPPMISSPKPSSPPRTVERSPA